MRRARTAFALLTAILAPFAAVGAQPTAVGAPPVGATTVDFNGLAQNTLVTNQFPGFVISGGACTVDLYSGNFSGDPMQVANFSQPQNAPCTDAASATFFPLTFTFASPITFFGMRVISNANVTLTEALGSLTYVAPVITPATWIGFQDATPFSVVTISADVNGAFAFDDVSYLVSAVPEPSALLLSASGLLIVIGGAVARRRRS